MKSVRYSRYTGEDFGLSAEDLMKALADFFLESGFDNPYMQFSEFNEHSLEELKRAIEEALQRGDFFDPERAEQIRQKLESMSEEEMDQLLGKLVQKLVDEGYIDTEQQAGGVGQKEGRVDVKITDKSVDFLGFKTLKDLLGSLGHVELRRARYARSGDRRRDQRRGQAVRVRRHHEPGRLPDAVQRHAARRRQAAA